MKSLFRLDKSESVYSNGKEELYGTKSRSGGSKGRRGGGSGKSLCPRKDRLKVQVIGHERSTGGLWPRQRVGEGTSLRDITNLSKKRDPGI